MRPSPFAHLDFRIFAAVSSAGALALGLGACGTGGTAPETSSAAAEAAAEESADSAESEAASPAAAPASAAPAAPDVEVIPGFEPGEFPSVPLFVIPDIALLNQSEDSFAIDLHTEIGDVDGVTVAPAVCDAAGTPQSGGGNSLLYDGSASAQDGAQRVENRGDGSGTYTEGSVRIENRGDGSGTYSNGAVSIVNNGDGTGSYDDGALRISVDGHGAGTYSNGAEKIENDGSGAGSYSRGALTIVNDGDGSGSYRSGATSIVNNGDGTGLVNGTEVTVDPLPPVPRLGEFPPVDALAPVESCGTVITFEDGLLFDFGMADIRPDAADVIDTVADVLISADVSEAEVSGHTDSIGTHAFNQDLSERRAHAAAEGLRAQGVSSELTAAGYGETRPVAANEVEGEDNPAGRQLNRRVEIFVPVF